MRLFQCVLKAVTRSLRFTILVCYSDVQNVKLNSAVVIYLKLEDKSSACRGLTKEPVKKFS